MIHLNNVYLFFNILSHGTKRYKLSMQGRVRLVILGALMSITVVLNENKKLDGYKFPVYSTPFCPRNESEWNKRSSVLNCNQTNGYTCLPNENFTELLEFCYTQRWILIEEGYCLYLERNSSYVDSYSCQHFLHGCHRSSYQSTRIYEHPDCISLGNGCFLAEQSCERSYRQMTVKTISRNTTPDVSILSSPKTTHRPETPVIKKDWLWLVILIIGIVVLFVFIFMFYLYRKKKNLIVCRQGPDRESEIQLGEETSLMYTNEKSNDETQFDGAIFKQWNQDDCCFIPTKAYKEVKKLIKSRNLVIVAGHSGSGKSAIIQHIALKYREQGWNVIRVKKVEDILCKCSSNNVLPGIQNNKTIFVFNDPLGKEYFDEILNSSWQTYEEDLTLYLKTAKLVMSCRSHIINDPRLTSYLANQSDIVDLENSQYKLSADEKRQILTKLIPDMNLSETDCDEILAVEKYFPLLCKLYSSEEENKNKGKRFFTEPVKMLKEEIVGFQKKDKGKFCALALLVRFNDGLFVSNLLKNKDTENKFKHTLKLCGLPENTPPSSISDYLNSIKGYFVKKVDDTYNFYDDFVMTVTTYVFGTYYPIETVNDADVGFLRRRVRLENCEEHNDSCTIYLCDRYIKKLGERLFTELFGKRLLDVVLNPCLRNEKLIKVLKKKIAAHPEKLQVLLETKESTIDNQDEDLTYNCIFMSNLTNLILENEVCPLFLLMVFRHTKLSLYCVKALIKKQIDLTSCSLIFAICCNGSVELFNTVFKNNAKQSLKKVWKGFYPIHIVSMCQNYELLDELIKIGTNTQQRTNDNSGGWTPLMLAAGIDIPAYNLGGESDKIRRDRTVQILLVNKAGINLCSEDGTSPLHIACINGHDSTVQLLLIHEANINLCNKKGASPLHMACQNGHDSTVQLLLNNEADMNLCDENGASPLHMACQNGHESIVQLLLKHEADINL